MMKRLFFWNVLALAAILLPANLMAQEVIEPVDSIWIDTVTVDYNDIDEVIEIVDTVSVDENDMIVDSVLTETGEIVADTLRLSDGEKWKRNLPQYDLKEYEWVDICYNPKYAIVTKNNRKGIYDLELHRNVTEVVYRDLWFSKQTMAEDSAYISLFYATMGIKRGIISLYEPDNNVVSIWMDDPDEVYKLDECTTIDKKLKKKATSLLGKLMKQEQMENAQIVVIDVKSGRLKTWVRLDRDTEKDEAGKLLAHSCTASLTKPFHTVIALENDSLSLDNICGNSTYRHGIKRIDDKLMRQTIMNSYRRSVAEGKWRALTDTRNPSTSPFIMAVWYNSLANGGTMIIPTMKADSVNIEKDVFSVTSFANLKQVLKVDRVASPQLAWLSTDTEWLGYATTEHIFADDDKESTLVVGKQVGFAGYFPIEKPRYTICIVGNKLSADATPTIFQNVINPLAAWLLKRK